MVHGDDFTFSGEPSQLEWAAEQMQRVFSCKIGGVLGDDPGQVQQLTILNRIISWTPDGITYEADPRHAEILQRLAKGPPVTTPGTKPSAEDLESSPPLEERDAVFQFQSSAARGIYLSLDRADLGFAAKETCRRMSCPRKIDMESVQRMGRYLSTKPRAVYHFQWQHPTHLDVYIDSDYAGCQETRRSTSGGVALLGTHPLKHWSATQRAVSLSSGEAELGAILKGAAEGLGMQSLAADHGEEIRLKLWTDASAAIGICSRTGIGKVRHLSVGQLWAQEKLRVQAFSLHKQAGYWNPADMLTKHVPREVLERHSKTCGLTFPLGWPEGAPHAFPP